LTYGTDVLALDDVQDPEVLVSEELNLAYALARRWLLNPEDIEEIGETEPYDCIDVRDWLGDRFSLTDRTVLDDRQTQAAQVLLGDPRVDHVIVVATFTQGTLRLSAQGFGKNGPFKFVLGVNGVTAQLLRGG
jgi:hypothetical protein